MTALEINTSYVYMVKNKITGHFYIGRQVNPKNVIGLNYFTNN